MSNSVIEVNFVSNYPEASVSASLIGILSKDVLVKMFCDVLSNSLNYAFDAKKTDSEITINFNLKPII